MIKKESDTSDMIRKAFHFEISDITTKRNKDGDDIGLFSGLIATANKDLVGDVIEPTAFDETLQDYRNKKRRIPIFYQHNLQNVPIGGVDANQISWDGDAKGWRVTNAELDLGVLLAKDVYSALKKRNLSDLSIGYRIIEADWDTDRNVQILKKISLGEFSVVSHPANQEAVIDSVKGATGFKDLPVGNRDRPWSKRDALPRIRKLTGSVEAPSRSYKNAFFWYDSENASNFGSYKFPFADVINGRLTAIPRAVVNAKARLANADIPDADKKKVLSNIHKYFKKMDIPIPPDSKELDKHYELFAGLLSDVEEEKEKMPLIDSMGDIEDVLQEKGFSANQRRILISKIKEFNSDNCDDCGKDGTDCCDDDSSIVEEVVDEKLNQLINLTKK